MRPSVIASWLHDIEVAQTLPSLTLSSSPATSSRNAASAVPRSAKRRRIGEPAKSTFDIFTSTSEAVSIDQSPPPSPRVGALLPIDPNTRSGHRPMATRPGDWKPTQGDDSAPPTKRATRTPSPGKRASQRIASVRNRALYETECLTEEVVNEMASDDPTGLDDTPRASRRVPLRPVNLPAPTYPQLLASEPPPARSNSPSKGSRSESSTSGAPSSSRRSTSPIKRVAGLSSVGAGIFYKDMKRRGAELGPDGRELCRALLDVADKMEIFPAALPEDWLAPGGDDEGLVCIRPHQRNSNDRRTEVELLSELGAVKEINRASQRCSEDLDSEPEWNMAVHGPMLRLAAGRGGQSVDFKYITNARIDPCHVPPQLSGLATATKMVDFAIFLDPSIDRSDGAPDKKTSPSLGDVISSITSTPTESINHTTYYSLRRRPVAVSVETKTMSRTEEEALVQLGVWAMAQMQSMLALARRFGVRPQGLLEEDMSIRDLPAGLLDRMVLPLVYVHSSRWTVFFARPQAVAGRDDVRVDIFRGVDVGDTSTPEGTYQLLRGLRELCKWVDTRFYRLWENILGVGSRDLELSCN
ncbi:hypothetical protein QBC33DRAFT_547518 [Phialemonium atrogriseum]|uniref:PD-(D/E)XK nuclease-like domain-containing protein n=1 Tax=Phialemonium atrogriseum TaxID=1093897 RepID=A0AAJ0FED3_9PEZI|nr:uncharacterized protein QBC33DRAFT_547518 [Phialemonium atrogriseum]KAK1764217.1 hypothetical protein QBC33DRAFT_547518 [Phialemonium atrogriseum]